MAKDVLLEIGLEEMPAHIVSPSRIQLENKVKKFLEQNRLTYETIESFSTPRRLAIRVAHLAERQEDISEEVKGPAKKIALDEAGQWSKAAQGFVRGQGVSTDEITFKELNGVEYVYVTKHVKGNDSLEVLKGLQEVIMSLTFPITMHWGNYHFEYIRPIHWLVALFGETIIPFSVLDVQTSNTSLGHRFLGGKVTINNPSDYEAQLKKEFVIACPTERQAMIKAQIDQLVQKNNWYVELDAKLLEEVTNLVEFPTVFVGSFAKKYLEVPEEVLVTSMKEHQRYFDVRNQQKSLLPYFISVRNGNDVHLENVIKGNEKVLFARLEDAEFFYNEDKKLSIAQCVEKLKQVTFHEKIGSVYQKMQRVQTIAQIIGKKINLTTNELKELQRVSEIYKFHLVTNMVGEFPELQGIMGEKYARLQGETASVAQAIREHYLPISSEGMLPESDIGAVLAIADKLDSVVSFFAKGIIPSSSNDPYALRRQAYGIIRIIEAKKWTFPLVQLQEEIAQVFSNDLARYGIQLVTENEKVTDFIKARIRQLLLTKNIRYDVIDAVISSKQKDLTQLFLAAETLKQHVEDPNFKPSVEALTRVINLAKKGHDFINQEIEINEALFENDSERMLNQAVNELEQKFQNNSMTENYQELMNLRPLIEDYFDQTMIMVDDEKQKINRLNELERIARLALLIASVDLLIVK